MGIPAIEDPFNGNITGAWKINCLFIMLDAIPSLRLTVVLANVDPKTFKRSYSANGYYFPVQSRPNLVVCVAADAILSSI